MQLHLDGRGSLSRQIDRAVRQLIERGVLSDGDRIPGSRALARQLSVSRNTVLAALHNLEIEGFVEPRSGSGTYVRARTPARSLSSVPAPSVTRSKADRGVVSTNATPLYDFRYGRVEWPAATDRAWRSSVRKASRHQRFHARVELAGDLELRRAISRHLALQRSLHCDPENLIVTSGTRETLALVGAVRVLPGSDVVLESPGYPMFGEFVRELRARARHLPVDADGLVTDELPRNGAALAIITPAHQFPTGCVMSFERRRALVAWARVTRTVLFEDDYDGEFRYGARPVAPLWSREMASSVVYSTSFSKTLSPELRLGFGLFPDELIDDVLAAKRRLFGPTSQLIQTAVSRFVESGEYRRHVKRVGKSYEEKRRRLIDCIDAVGSASSVVRPSPAGTHTALPLPVGYPTSGLVEDLRGHGVLVSGTYEEVTGAGARSSLILGIGAIDRDAIAAGVERMIDRIEKRGSET